MPRRRRVIEEEKPPKSEVIVIWCTKETKLRWRRFYDYHVTLDKHTYKNSEVLLNKLLDLYDLCRKYLNREKIDDLIDKLREILGESRILVAR